MIISLRDGPWKLLTNAALDRFELYDLTQDLNEARDLSTEHPDRLQALLAELKRRQAEVAAEGTASGNPGK